MGFYPPDFLIHDAHRRDVAVLSANVNLSKVRCHVEQGEGGLAVRLGLAYIKKVSEEEMEEVWSQSGKPTASTAASVIWPPVRGPPVMPLSASPIQVPWTASCSMANAVNALGMSGTTGTARGPTKRRQLSLPLEPSEAPELEPMNRWETIVEDYRSTGVNLGTHPMALMRPSLSRAIATSSDLNDIGDESIVEVAGMVIARQRPETAKGITFMLLEDERGPVNLVVPSSVYDGKRAVVRAAPLVHARGRLERREGVVNVVVTQIGALEWREPKKSETQDERSGDRRRHTRARGDEVRWRRSLRRHAVADLRAVVPAGHSFGRRA